MTERALTFDSDYGQDYIAVVIDKIGTMQYAVTFEIRANDPAYAACSCFYG